MLVLLYGLEVIKYCMAYYVCFNEKAKRHWIAFVGGLGYLAILVAFPNEEMYTLHLLMYFITLCGMLLMMGDKWKKKFVQLLILIFILCSLEECTRMVVEALKISRGIELQKEAQDLIISISNFILFGLLVVLKKRLKEKDILRIKVFFRKSVLVLVLLMSVGMLFTIGGLSYARDHIDNLRFDIVAMVVCAISYISICFVGICAIYINNLNKRTEDMMQNEILLRDMQKRYYDALLEREEDTRKYRHDMVNHLIFLNKMVDDKDWTVIKSYLSEMQGEIDYIQKKCYVTGNKILDVMTNYYASLLPESVLVNVTGKANVVIDEMKLCTIYSNLLQNAVEELQRIQGQKDAFLEINFREGKKFLQIVIRNSLAQQEEGKSSFETKKEDKRNHGIGLKNVKKAVEDVEGELSIKRDKDYFEVIVTLKLNN